MISNSLLRVRYCMACTGLNGTTTGPWTLGISPSSTTRTCCWESPGWDRLKWWTTHATSMKTLKTRSLAVSMFTTRRRRNASTLASSMARRESVTVSSQELVFGCFRYFHSTDTRLLSFPVGPTTQRSKSKALLTGACWQHTVELDTIKTWVAPRRRAAPYWKSWWTTCGWTEGPGCSSLTSPHTTQTSTCSVLSGRHRPTIQP